GRSAKGKRIHTRAIHSIDTDIKLNRALWVMAETCWRACADSAITLKTTHLFVL
ncbi:hypothetical protein MLN82_25735, partial [Escherichia coli]|nr:hypothetical protein [Escherichia coli]